jgi:hypothetical protein
MFQGFVHTEPVVEKPWYYRTDLEKLKSGRPMLVGQGVAPGLANRKNRWSSRDEARAFFLKSREYRKYDPRVFEQVMLYDFERSTGWCGWTSDAKAARYCYIYETKSTFERLSRRRGVCNKKKGQ